MSRQRLRRRSVVIIVAATLLAVVLGLGALVIFAVKIPPLTPEGALSNYVTAIQSGELDRAEVLEPGPAGSAQPVAGAALANPADRITAVATAIRSHTDHSATGTVRFQLAGHRYSTTLQLSRGPAQLGLLPNWRVTTPLTTTIAVKVPAGERAVVNGVTVPLGAAQTVDVYPGHYSVGLAPDSRWYRSSTVGVDAATARVSVQPTVTPTAALSTEVRAQVKSAIDACIATASPVPPGCPFSEQAVGTLAGFHWALDEYPTVAFLDPTHVFLQGGQVTANFVFTHSYIVGKPEEDPVAIKGIGSLAFSGASVKVTIVPH